MEDKYKLKPDNYKIILIIGNGFDLNLGLNTSYNDFVNSSLFDNLVNNNNLLSKHLKNKHELENWIDIENELKYYSKKEGKNNNNFNNEFITLSQSLNKYLYSIDYNKINKSSKAFELIDRIKDEEILILNYNYTPTLLNILTELKPDLNSHYNKLSFIHIHGSVKNNNIIFGVEDSARISSEHIFLKKSVNKNFITTNINSIIKECDELIVFGHSLGETDHMYFSDFFSYSSLADSKLDKKITLFHYGQKNYYEIFKQIDSMTNSRIAELKQNNNFTIRDLKELK